MERIIARIAVDANVSPSAVKELCGAAGYACGEGEAVTRRYVWYDAQDGALYADGYRCVYDGNAEEVRIERRGETVCSQPHESEDLPVQGPVAEFLSGACESHRPLPWAAGHVGSTRFELSREGEGAVAVTREAWRFHDPRAPDVLVRREYVVCEAGASGGDHSDILTCVTNLGEQAAAPDVFTCACHALDAGIPGAPTPTAYRVTPSQSLAEATQAILAAQRFAMWANTRGAACDLDDDFVHDVRVATRRSRWALKLLTPYFGRDVCGPMRAELKWIADLLGRVRDLDVFLAWFETADISRTASSAVSRAITRRLRQMRGPSQGCLRDALRSERYRALLDAMARGITPGDDAKKDANVPVTDAATERIAATLKTLAKWRRHDPHDLSLEELHKVRIRFKRVRYTCEFFAGCFDGQVKKFIRKCKGFQDCLGELNDARVARGIVLRVIDSFKGDEAGVADILVELGRVLQAQDVRIARARENFLEEWDAFPAAVKKLKKSVAG